MRSQWTASRTSAARRVAAIILALTVIRVWAGDPFDPPRALGQSSPPKVQTFDSSSLAKKQIEEAQKTNALLADILKHLQSGTVNVRQQSTDKKESPPQPSKG